VAEARSAPIAPVRRHAVDAGRTAQIDDWLTCPLKYLFAHVAHVPLAGDPSFMYGNAIHHAIKIWHQHRIRGCPSTSRMSWARSNRRGPVRAS